MEFGQRLKNLRLERGFTQQDLASAIGVTVVAVRNWERGVRKPAMEAIVALGKTLNISADILLGISLSNQPKSCLVLSPAEKTLLQNYQSLDAHGRKTVETICLLEKERMEIVEAKPTPKIVDFETVKKNSDRFIPRYTTPSAAGFNIPLDGTDFEMLLVDDDVPSDADYAVDIQGNSMSPYIHDGDMVYVKKCEELSIGDVGIFCVDGAMYCKQYYIDDEGNLTLVSANPAMKHTNIFLPVDSGSSVRFCGKVLLNQRIDLPDYLFED